jgi:hypothetical protein
MKTLFALALFSVVTTQTLFSQQPNSHAVVLKANWPVFAPRQNPPGRFVTEAEAAKLADAGEFREVLYLIGSFRVTASRRGGSRVVLRSDSKVAPIRVVADYPPSIPTPAEGTKLVRDKSRCFLITDIRRGPDGQITVYARAITLPIITG